jgi:molybdate transport system substrate-binding protein
MIHQALRVWSGCVAVAILFAAAAAVAAQESEKPGTVLVAAAADLKFALDEIIAEFKKAHPEFAPEPTYGSSGTLFAQIDNGAPFDLFLAADSRYPRRLIEAGRAEADSLFVYAIGHVVIWARKESPIDWAKVGASGLLDERVRKVAIANPEVAPYGAAAVAALKHFKVHEAIASKLVLGENVAQTAQFVESGAADAGLISLSLAVAPKMKEAGRYWEAPVDSYPVLEQAGVIPNKGRNRAGAAALREFLVSARGREILRRYGFALPAGAE